ncbi:hypothetical protein TNCV_3657621 [Trichonephila clavipes]|nr:hypothetical protein TNCV_3657621 [Trichonephila clavipes]
MKIGNNGNLVLGPFDESTPCLIIFKMCLPGRDLRTRNLLIDKYISQTVPDRFPVPHVHDFAHNPYNKRIFSTIGLLRAYHQIPVAAADGPKQQL